MSNRFGLSWTLSAASKLPDDFGFELFFRLLLAFFLDLLLLFFCGVTTIVSGRSSERIVASSSLTSVEASLEDKGGSTPIAAESSNVSCVSTFLKQCSRNRIGPLQPSMMS